MITSPQNEKLKLVRKLRDRKHREREGLFVTEGEDLLRAGLESGAEPEALLCAPGSGLDGEEVEPELLDSVSALGSGTRAIGVWRESWAQPGGSPCVYLHGVGDPANVGAVLRIAQAFIDGPVVLGPGCADPHSAKAVRAGMGSIFGQPVARAELAQTPSPRAALIAHGGEPIEALAGAATICLGAEREGLPAEVVGGCEVAVTIPLRPGGAESLNVAAAAAIACERISSLAPHEVGE